MGAAGRAGHGGRAGDRVLRRQIGRFEQLARLLLVHALDQAGHLAEAGGNGRGQPLAAGDEAIAPAARLHQDRLQHAVPLDRLDERRGGRGSSPRTSIVRASIRRTDGLAGASSSST
jgi:hypothetical protein